jgi:hypothetical protein
MDQRNKEFLVEKITEYFRRLQNISYKCSQFEKGEEYLQGYSHTSLQKKLNSILASGNWDNSRLTQFLDITKVKTGSGVASIIGRDARAITIFLERVIYDLQDSPSWFTEEETTLAAESKFRIEKEPSFIFEMETAIGSLEEAAIRALAQVEANCKHYLRSKSGGSKPKKAIPLMFAAEIFLQTNPRLQNRSNKEIVDAFCKKYKDGNEPLKIHIGDDVYEIFSDRENEYIFFRMVESPNRNKLQNDAKSITKLTFTQRYISAAKNNITSRNH